MKILNNKYETFFYNLFLKSYSMFSILLVFIIFEGHYFAWLVCVADYEVL